MPEETDSALWDEDLCIYLGLLFSTLQKDACSTSSEAPPKTPDCRVQGSQLRSRMRHQGTEYLVVSEGGTLLINLALSKRHLWVWVGFGRSKKNNPMKNKSQNLESAASVDIQANIPYTSQRKNFLRPFLSSLLPTSAPLPRGTLVSGRRGDLEQGGEALK